MQQEKTKSRVENWFKTVAVSCIKMQMKKKKNNKLYPNTVSHLKKQQAFWVKFKFSKSFLISIQLPPIQSQHLIEWRDGK